MSHQSAQKRAQLRLRRARPSARAPRARRGHCPVSPRVASTSTACAIVVPEVGRRRALAARRSARSRGRSPAPGRRAARARRWRGARSPRAPRAPRPASRRSRRWLRGESRSRARRRRTARSARGRPRSRRAAAASCVSVGAVREAAVARQVERRGPARELRGREVGDARASARLGRGVREALGLLGVVLAGRDALGEEARQVAARTRVRVRRDQRQQVDAERRDLLEQRGRAGSGRAITMSSETIATRSSPCSSTSARASGGSSTPSARRVPKPPKPPIALADARGQARDAQAGAQLVRARAPRSQRRAARRRRARTAPLARTVASTRSRTARRSSQTAWRVSRV